MAGKFLITAEIQFQSNNIQRLAAEINRQLNSVTGNIKFELPRNINNRLNSLNNTLSKTSSLFTQVRDNASAAADSVAKFNKALSVSAPAVVALNRGLKAVKEEVTAIGKTTNEATVTIEHF